MILDKNGRLFGKISIIDLLAILAVLVAAIGIGARFFTPASDNVREKVQLSYVVEIKDVRMYSIYALNNKGVVTDSKSGAVIGEITDVEYEPFTTHEVRSDGEAVLAEVPDKFVAYVSIKSEASETDNGYFVGDNIELSVGSSVSLATKYVNSNGKVKSIEKL